MEKEFVPPTESLALKELGFDEPTLYHWHNSEKNHPLTNEIYFTGCQPSTNSGIKDIGNENHVWSAPLYQQAFRWFRERYQLYSFVKGEYEYGGITPTYYITGKRQADIPGGPFNTYEEAELACLRKLIEIVKEK
jgi:hypothetical protein